MIHYGSQYGIPGEEAFIDMKQTKELLRTSFAPELGALHTLTIEGGHADYEHSEIELATGEIGSTFTDDEWDARVEALFVPIGPFSAAAFGAQFQNLEFAALGEGEDYLLPTETRIAAAFAFADVPVSARLHLHIGARVESVDVDGTPAVDVPTSRSFTPVSASAGLLFDASDALRLGLTLSSAARAPGQTELYARGPHEATATFEIGNADFEEERANSLEATLRFDAGSVALDAAVWRSEFSDYIFGNLTGRTCDDEGVCADGDAGEREPSTSSAMLRIGEPKRRRPSGCSKDHLAGSKASRSRISCERRSRAAERCRAFRLTISDWGSIGKGPGSAAAFS